MGAQNLTDWGGCADGQFDNSRCFQRALETLKDQGGGVLELTRGVWKTGPIRLHSRTTLILREGAVLSFIPDPALYPPVMTRWEGVDCFALHPCLFAAGAEEVSVQGDGTIDGGGEGWWNLLREKRARGQSGPETLPEKQLAELNPDYRNQPGGGGGREIQFLRPPAVQFYECRNVFLGGITIINSPFWSVHPVYSSRITISGIRIENPGDAPNTDGIDVDSCEEVLITHCRISVGDDGIALKSGSGFQGMKKKRPTCRVTVRNCVVEKGHGGIVIGSETAGGIHHVHTEDCLFDGTDRGIRIKTRRGRGGEIRNLIFRNLEMRNNLCPVAINMFYRCGVLPGEKDLFSTEPRETGPFTPKIENIHLSGIRATGCRASAGFLAGLPESPIANLIMEDCRFQTREDSGVSPGESDMFLGLPEVSEKSIRILNLMNPVFTRVEVSGPEESFLEG